MTLEIISALLFIIVFVCMILIVPSKLGWTSFEKSYGLEGTNPSSALKGVSINLYWEIPEKDRFPKSLTLKRGVNVAVDNRGLYFSLRWPASLISKWLFFPWSEIKTTETNFVLKEVLVQLAKEPKMCFGVTPELWKLIIQQKGSSAVGV